MSAQDGLPHDRNIPGREPSGDRFDDPEFWAGTISKRAVAYVVDIFILGAIGVALWIVTVLTLGLLAPVTAFLGTVAPLAYHTLMVSGRGATIGQGLLGLRVADAETGERPSLVQALILTCLFYVSVMLSFLPLLYGLIDDKSRFLHDIFSGVRAVRSDARV